MLKNQITLNHVLVKSEGSIVSDMDGEKVMLSVKNGKYYNLGEIGGEILESVSNPVSVNHIINHLTSIYNVEHTECEAQVLEFLEQLLDEELIQFS